MEGSGGENGNGGGVGVGIAVVLVEGSAGALFDVMDGVVVVMVATVSVSTYPRHPLSWFVFFWFFGFCCLCSLFQSSGTLSHYRSQRGAAGRHVTTVPSTGTVFGPSVGGEAA